MHKKMETQRLHNPELKRLACVLSGIPISASAYQATTKAIKHLPHRLLASNFATSSTLCSMHASLDHHLLNEIWSWVRHEFSAIGRFILPLLVSNMLSANQERKIRQLEPVLQIWRKDFVFELSGAPGREPINTGDKWTYQADQCSACMLARIGSSDSALRALYAGMLARFPLGKLTTSKVILAELGASAFDDPKSKRVRFVRYWIKQSAKGMDLLFSAADLGIGLKKLHKQWKGTQDPERVSLYRGQAQDPFTDHAPSRPHTPATPSQSSYRPRSFAESQHHPSAQVAPLNLSKTLPRTPSSRPPSWELHPRPRFPSDASTYSCSSFDNAPPAWKSHFQNQGVPEPQAPVQTRAQAPVHPVSTGAPSVHRFSMYYGSGDVQAEVDPFEGAYEGEDGDEEVDEWGSVTPVTLVTPPAPAVDRADKRVTQWRDLYEVQ